MNSYGELQIPGSTNLKHVECNHEKKGSHKLCNRCFKIKKNKLVLQKKNTNKATARHDNYLEVEKVITSSTAWMIDGEVYKAQAYCFSLRKGDYVKFIEGTPGLCVSAKVIKQFDSNICNLWCK